MQVAIGLKFKMTGWAEGPLNFSLFIDCHSVILTLCQWRSIQLSFSRRGNNMIWKTKVIHKWNIIQLEICMIWSFIQWNITAIVRFSTGGHVRFRGHFQFLPVRDDSAFNHCEWHSWKRLYAILQFRNTLYAIHCKTYTLHPVGTHTAAN